jgi:hypothetical protein
LKWQPVDSREGSASQESVVELPRQLVHLGEVDQDAAAHDEDHSNFVRPIERGYNIFRRAANGINC